MHGRLAALRSVSSPGHLQAVGQRSRVARQPRAGSATSGAPAEQPVRSRGACGDEQSSGEPSCPVPGHRPGRPAAGGRSAADGKRCSGARRADRDSSSVLRRVARRGAGQPRECGAVAGTGGGRGQNRGLCAPLPRLRRRAARRQMTRRVPAPAPQWRPARPTHLRRHRPPRRRPRTAAPQQRARPMERHLRGRRLPVQRALTAAVEQRWPASRSGSAFQQRRCHPAAPEYPRFRAEPGLLAPRRQVSGSAPAVRIRLRPVPARPLPRQHASTAAARVGRATPRTRRATRSRARCRDPSAAALRPVDGHLQRVAVGRHGPQRARAAPPRGACSSRRPARARWR